MTEARMMALVCALALAACAPQDRGPKWRPAGNATPRDGGTLRLSISGQLSSLDPAYGGDEYTAMATHAMFETLVDFEPASPTDPHAGQRLVPGLAERWDVSPDGLVYTFTLRAGLVYSDGTPVVADDFRTSIERELTTADTASSTVLAEVVGAAALVAGTAPHAAGLEVRGPRAFAIHLAHPNVGLLGILTMVFTTPQPARRAPDRRTALGTGPFELVTWTQGQRIVLRKNPRYWDASHIHLAAIEIAENVAPDISFLQFERGELDASARLVPPDELWLDEQPAWQPYIRRAPRMTTFGARMNVRVPPFDDVRVRQALNYALDKQHVLKVLLGDATAAHGPIPPGMLGRDDDIAPYPHDLAKARALLAAAGHPDGFDLDYVYAVDDLALAQVIQADLGEIGVRVHLKPLAQSEWQQELASSKGAPFTEAAWELDYPDTADVFDAEFHSRAIAAEGGTNFAQYSNPELDALADAARGEADPVARAALYRRGDRILHDDAPWLWTHHDQMLDVVQPYVAGYALHPIWVRDYTRAWLDVGSDGAPVAAPR